LRVGRRLAGGGDCEAEGGLGYCREGSGRETAAARRAVARAAAWAVMEVVARAAVTRVVVARLAVARLVVARAAVARLVVARAAALDTARAAGMAGMAGMAGTAGAAGTVGAAGAARVAGGRRRSGETWAGAGAGMCLETQVGQGRVREEHESAAERGRVDGVGH